MKNRIYPLFIFGLSLACVFSSSAQIEPPGHLVKSFFPLVVSRFMADPSRGLIYASVVQPTSEVAVINPATLTITKTIPLSAAPGAMAIAPDGTKLYVALGGVTQIGVIDLATLTALPSLNVPVAPEQLAAGLGNRLYLSVAGGVVGLIQVDATTGAEEATLDANSYLFGLLQISPDHTQLYFGGGYSQDSQMERFDISTATAVLEQTYTYFDSFGFRLSHNGQLLALTPDVNYPDSTGVFNPADFDVEYGTFSVGEGPSYLAFSPEDTIAYEGNGGPGDPADEIELFDTATFAQIGSFLLPHSGVFDLIADNMGRHLFVADQVGVEVFDVLDATLYASLNHVVSYVVPIEPYPATFQVSGLPNGVIFDAATRTLSGTPTEVGTFPVLITATAGTRKVTATITLAVYPIERALNISTRADVLKGDDVLIAGFIISGAARKGVIVRALGPSLKANGQPLAGSLGNPMLSIYNSSGSLVASNDDWQSDYYSYIVKDLNLAPTDSREAALSLSLEPGSYTMVVSGAKSTTGIGLAEVYDGDGASTDETQLGVSRLSNISTRGKVETGDRVMIGGIILGGPAESKMLFRAIGPSLSSSGISDPLPDPQLDLYNANGDKIASNNNWKDSQKAEIEATGLAPKNDLESAILVTLQPAAYTAIVSGVGGETGVGLVEAYNLP